MANMLILRALTGELRGLEFAFTGPVTVTLGRSRGCTLRLTGDATVSRQHCILEMDDYGLWVQDLGSLNGTHVNGEKVGQRTPVLGEDATMVQPPRHALVDGDELRVCNNLFAVELTAVDLKRQPEKAHRPGSSEMEIAVCI